MRQSTLDPLDDYILTQAQWPTRSGRACNPLTTPFPPVNDTYRSKHMACWCDEEAPAKKQTVGACGDQEVCVGLLEGMETQSLIPLPPWGRKEAMGGG